MELSEILDYDMPSLDSVLVSGRQPSNTTSPNLPPDFVTPGPTPPVDPTEGPGGGSNTLFSLIKLVTREATTADPGESTSESSVVGTILNMANSTLAEVTNMVTEAVKYDGSTVGPFPQYNLTSQAPSIWSTAGPGGVSSMGPFNTTQFVGNSSVLPPFIFPTDGSGISVAAMEHARAEALRIALWQWMSPFIFLFGFFGNIAILIVLATRPVMSDNTTSTYVRCLAIADLLTVITGIIPEWMAFSGIFNVEEVHPISCKFYKFFAYTASDASIWILAAFSIERFIAVVFPFKRQKGWCKVSQVKIICVGLVLLGVGKNLQSFWTRGAAYKPGAENGTLILRSNCGYPTEADVFFNLYVRPWIVLVTVSIIPMLILWFCNFAVIWAISRRRTIQRLQLQMSTANKKANAITQQVTIMCLCASFSFIVFMTPSFILFVGKAYWAYDPTSRGPYLIAKAINNQLMYINNSINFYLYLFSGARFRESVISIFIRCQWSKAVRDARSMSMRPQSTAVSRPHRGRRDPYEVTVLTNNGARLKSSRDVSRDVTPNETPDDTPMGSRESLQRNNKY